jgi:hypothetical protein
MSISSKALEVENLAAAGLRFRPMAEVRLNLRCRKWKPAAP